MHTTAGTKAPCATGSSVADVSAVTVTLREVTEASLDSVLKVHTTSAQERFVSTVADSLSEAAATPQGSPWYRAVYADERPVGFVMVSRIDRFIGQVGMPPSPRCINWAGTRVERMHEHERFDDKAATWDDDPRHEERQAAVAQVIVQAVRLDPRMRALDIGCGTGRLSVLLSDRVGSVVVTDPSAGMVQVARERIVAAGLSDRLRAVQADLTTDPVDGAYDVAWSSMALHHVRDLDGLLRSVAALLVDGGQLAIADLDRDLDGAYHAEDVDFEGHHGFDRQRLTEQLAHAGFTEVSFVDATTILKSDREFGVFVCTATKRP